MHGWSRNACTCGAFKALSRRANLSQTRVIQWHEHRFFLLQHLSLRLAEFNAYADSCLYLFTPRELTKNKSMLLAQHSRRLRIDPWIFRNVELTVCVFGTFLGNFTENNEFHSARVSLRFLSGAYTGTTSKRAHTFQVLPLCKEVLVIAQSQKIQIHLSSVKPIVFSKVQTTEKCPNDTYC